MPTLSVQGTDNLVAKFQALAKGAQSTALANATRAAALPVLNQIRTTVNEGGRTPYKSGTLRRSFTMRTTVRTPTRCVVQIGTNVPYARRLEYGFVGADSLGRIYHQPAHPYIRPAMAENRHTVRKEFRASMQAILAGSAAGGVASAAD